MVLVLFMLTLMFVTSWQQDVTEKSLNEILDQLIEETVLTTHSNENDNNSKIIYIKQDNLTRRNIDSRLNTVNSGDYENFDDLAHKTKSFMHKINSDPNIYSNERGHDIAVQIEHTAEHYHVNDAEYIDDIDIMNNDISKTAKPFEDIPNNIVVLTSDPESNLIHKYPEIIIDKISYDLDEKINKPKVETAQRASVIKQLTDAEKKEVAANALDSLMKMIIQRTQIGRRMSASIENELEDNIQRSTHIHNAYHNHVINNVPLSYSGLLQRGKMSLGKLPQGYRDLHRIINRPRNAYLDPKLQLSTWGGKAGQTPLMSISRSHDRSRVHFIPESLNILPRIVYGPLFSRKYSG